VQERINTYDTAHKIGAVAKMPTNIYLKNNSNAVSVSVAPVQMTRHLCDGTECPRPARLPKGQWQSQSRFGAVAKPIEHDSDIPRLTTCYPL